MQTTFHLLRLAVATGIIWALSGLLVEATNRVARRYDKPGFAIAFFLLGFLTSVSEMSVAVNASIEGMPQISTGNLVGGSMVIFLFIMPFLSVLGNGVPMRNSMVSSQLACLLIVVALPALFAVDGDMDRIEGTLMIVAYFALAFIMQKRKPSEAVIERAISEVEERLMGVAGLWHKHKATAGDLFKISAAGGLIFLCGKIMVGESVQIANSLGIPASFIGLVVLSLGTNAPELVIAVRCVKGKHKDIAFGNYMGSAAANTAILGVLALANGAFLLEQSEFVSSFFLTGIGLTLFHFFAKSKRMLSRGEGLILLCLYAAFLLIQVLGVIFFGRT